MGPAMRIPRRRRRDDRRRGRGWHGLVAALVVALACGAGGAGAQDARSVPAGAPPGAARPLAASTAIEQAIAREVAQPGGSGAPLPRREREWLRAVYDGDGATPVWFTASGPRPAVASALATLRQAGTHGLDPGDYDPDAREREIATAADLSPERVARADVALTLALLRYASDLAQGRVAPQILLQQYEPPRRAFTAARELRAAVALDRVPALIAAAEPSFPPYRRLRDLLARYRSLAERPFAPLPALPPKVEKIEAGDTWAGVPALRERLQLLGDLAADAPAPEGNRHAGELPAALARFQSRHGLAADGVLGRRTLAALDVPPAARVRQIALSLERLRWLPELPHGPLIAINIPSFRLWAFADPHQERDPPLSMAVIVGRAFATETPVFIGEMRHLEFSPYWNVPPGILRHELLPALAKDAGYLERNDMELVRTAGGGTPLTTIDEATLASLRSGELRLRQRPGPKNALGGVKFVLPNTMDIYLHGTPAQQLFERTRRDFSHGCIRVADPTALARFALRDQPEWTPERIATAMAAGTMQVVKLTTTIPVIVFYTTAIARGDGQALFLPDVYGHDVELARALARRAGD